MSLVEEFEIDPAEAAWLFDEPEMLKDIEEVEAVAGEGGVAEQVVAATIEEETVAVRSIASASRQMVASSQQPPGKHQEVGPRLGDGSEDQLIRQYLAEIGQYPLLTKDDEVRLAQLIAAGQAAEKELADPILTLIEVDHYTAIVARANQAKQEYIRSNLRLVVSVAKRYTASGVSLLDMIQDGNIGLMRAVEKFDHAKGFRFSTYATWWIRQAITRGIPETKRTIRFPVHREETYQAIVQAQTRLFQELGREPTVTELAHVLPQTPQEVAEILKDPQQPTSLSELIGDEGGELGDMIPDTTLEPIEEQVLKGEIAGEVQDLLGQLSEREQKIMRLRFGLDGGRPLALDEVGREIGVTRERIRQIEAKVLMQLRHPQYSAKVQNLLEP